jgi:hypothetical protein
MRPWLNLYSIHRPPTPSGALLYWQPDTGHAQRLVFSHPLGQQTGLRSMPGARIPQVLRVTWHLQIIVLVFTLTGSVEGDVTMPYKYSRVSCCGANGTPRHLPAKYDLKLANGTSIRACEVGLGLGRCAPLILSIPDFLRDLVPLFLKRQRDRTPGGPPRGGLRPGGARRLAVEPLGALPELRLRPRVHPGAAGSGRRCHSRPPPLRSVPRISNARMSTADGRA